VAENSLFGWNGGFDVNIGNPPWDRVKLQEKEWFAERVPEIAKATNASKRKQSSVRTNLNGFIDASMTLVRVIQHSELEQDLGSVGR
jgi:hypothetical protein